MIKKRLNCSIQYFFLGVIAKSRTIKLKRLTQFFSPSVAFLLYSSDNAGMVTYIIISCCVIGKGEVIKGWDLGVATMKRGEQAIFFIRNNVYDVTSSCMYC